MVANLDIRVCLADACPDPRERITQAVQEPTASIQLKYLEERPSVSHCWKCVARTACHTYYEPVGRCWCERELGTDHPTRGIKNVSEYMSVGCPDAYLGTEIGDVSGRITLGLCTVLSGTKETTLFGMFTIASNI